MVVKQALLHASTTSSQLPHLNWPDNTAGFYFAKQLCVAPHTAPEAGGADDGSSSAAAHGGTALPQQQLQQQHLPSSSSRLPACAAVNTSFYVWLSVQVLLCTSSLWSLCADVFSHDAAPRLFGFISAGANAPHFCTQCPCTNQNWQQATASRQPARPD